MARTSMGSRKVCAPAPPACRQRLDLKLFGEIDETREIEGGSEVDRRAVAVAATRLLFAGLFGGLVDAAIWVATWANISDRRPKGVVVLCDCMSLP